MNIDTTWIKKFKRPFIIAGPCSAETKEQLNNTANSLYTNKNISLFRAGVWKPRTRPNSFAGVGSVALEWLKEIENEFKLKPIIEVASSAHAEESYQKGIRYFWIGARTTVNPFLVQEIADSFKGKKDAVIMIKNPVNPDLDLWIGAIERFYNAGINKLTVIHRGFSTSEKSKYRNSPKWSIPIELKKRFPNLPMICDPSHMSGNSDFIFDLSQKAIDLNYDGLMIETHCTPELALSDPDQQLTPQALLSLLESLNHKKISTGDTKTNCLLEQYRDEIDSIDEELLEAVSKRMKVIDCIKQVKKDAHLTAFQLKRWSELLSQRVMLGKKMGLNEELVEEIFSSIHYESIKKQIDLNWETK